MFTVLEFKNGKIRFDNSKVLLREYYFEYTNPVNYVKSEYRLKIYFDTTMNFMTNYAGIFIVEDLFGLRRLFDTFKDADTFAYSEMYNKYNKAEEESKEIEVYVAKHSKKKGKKKDEIEQSEDI